MLPELAQHFPDARFIIIWRNPADICRSVMRASKGDSFFAKRGMVLRALRGNHELKRGFDALVEKGTPVHAVQYETLVNDPAGVMAGVCRFLDLEFHPRMISLRDADRSAIYDAAHHEMVKSENITATKEKVDLLPPAVRKKIGRYIAYWHEQYESKWPAVPEDTNSKSGSWFLLEHFFDGILYRAFRSLDWAIVLIYCFAPLRLLRKYRTLRGRGEAVAIADEGLVGARAKE
jgi:hypothetical protein